MGSTKDFSLGVTRRRMLATIGLAGAALGSAGSRPARPAAETSFDKILAGAQAEGHLVVWAPDPVSEEAQAAAFSKFNERFGLRIAGEWLAINPAEGSARVIAEEAARGRASVDVIGSDSTEGMLTPFKVGVIKPYPYLDVFSANIPGVKAATELVVPGLRGVGLHEYDFVFGLAWNTTLVKERDLPKNVTDLTDPHFMGRFSLNQFALVPLDVISYAMGREATLDLARKLLDNKPVFARGSAVVANFVSTGAAPMGITGYHFIETAKRNGEPVEFRQFGDVIPVSPQHVYVLENSPNPNAARLFAAWFAAEGVQIVNHYNLMPNAFAAGSNLARSIKAQQDASGAKIAKVASVEMAEGGIEIRKAIQALLAEQGTK